ncbi:hypothetical protein [Paraburkholderia largidicola]|uniref:Uncharacterized protein n=1 Tax=Paraburkholderia largidicola TaxID=3014751 RepID=A0A7I8BIY6_9BURK|nr:hypothetical protein [Paraburkholderia sp. PGU16]BCF88684.1 hypothetical protein PPGU16_17510 [Paraburkholderia sp. PGU16]
MASPFTISVASNAAAVARGLSDIERKQLPFAIAQTITAVARLAAKAEKDAMPKIFDRPTPFTVNSVAVKGATKSNPEAVVYIKDIAAAYLAPYEFGGTHKLIGSGKTWLNPKDLTLLNKYGNLSTTTLNRLKGRPDIFVGTIKTRSGESIGGVWQRPAPTKVVRTPGAKTKALRGQNQSGHLKLLIRFGDAKPVRQHLEFGSRAQAVVQRAFPVEFGKALAKAVATRRR